MKNVIIAYCLFIGFFTVSLAQESKSITFPNEQVNLKAKKETRNVFLWEDFDSGVFPPANWVIDAGETDQTWRLGDSLIYPPVSANNFAICRYDDTYNPEGQDERLITPLLDLTGLSDATLNFWFLFSKYWGIKPYDNYDLQVLLSLDGGLTFNDTIWTELSADISSWSSWQWTWAEVDLTPYVDESQVKLCFRYVGFDGADAAIENVVVSFTTSLGESISQKINLFPNPTSDYFVIDEFESGLVQVYDLTGNPMFKDSNYDGENINVSFLPAGIYKVVLIRNNEFYSKTLLKQ